MFCACKCSPTEQQIKQSRSTIGNIDYIYPIMMKFLSSAIPSLTCSMPFEQR
jgi:hypothetical protein